MRTAKIAILTLMLGMLAACHAEKKGPMERAGENIDEAVEEAGDEIEDMTDRR